MSGQRYLLGSMPELAKALAAQFGQDVRKVTITIEAGAPVYVEVEHVGVRDALEPVLHELIHHGTFRVAE